MSAGQILVAKETFSTTIDGAPVVVHKDRTRVREGHPLLEGREELFEPISVDFDIEQTTAAPGEKRAGRGRKAAKATTSKENVDTAPEKPTMADPVDQNVSVDASAKDINKAAK